jgi:hypothetical protein
MHRSRFLNKTSSPGKVHETRNINTTKRNKASSSTRFLIFVVLGIAGLLLPYYYSFLSLYSNHQQSPVAVAIPEKEQDTTPNWTLPDLPPQIYQANFSNLPPPPPPPPIHSQFLIYKGFMKGQGTGNHMNGLLATHLLALEFNRTVCVSPDYKEFHLAFRSRQPALQEICAPILQEYNDNVNLRIMLNNFGKPPNECRLQQQLADSRQPVWVILANTYPRWPEVPLNFFFQYYEPTPALLAWLPYRTSPQTVVHLRTPDKHGADDRAGLDNATFQLLYQTLPSDTFLVTNNVAWYDHFPTWQHPAWTIVQHTATSKFWGKTPEPHAKNRAIQVLQMWVDWFTILSAQQVYHTASDFSHSAIHWQNLDARIIHGVHPNGTLDFVHESWIRDGLTPRLVDRKVHATTEKGELRLCKSDDERIWLRKRKKKSVAYVVR